MIHYLASPYSDPRPSMVAWRFKRNTRALHELTESGMTIFSPIFVGHQLAERGITHDYQWWMNWCCRFVDRSDRLLVLTLPGWLDSKGLAVEVRRAAERGIPVIGCDILKECDPVSGRDILKHFGVKEAKSW